MFMVLFHIWRFDGEKLSNQWQWQCFAVWLTASNIKYYLQMVHKWRFCSMTHSHTSFTVMVWFGRHFIAQCMVTVWNLYFSALVLIIFVRSLHLLTVKGSAVLDELLFLHRNVSDWRIPDVTAGNICSFNACDHRLSLLRVSWGYNIYIHESNISFPGCDAWGRTCPEAPPFVSIWLSEALLLCTPAVVYVRPSEDCTAHQEETGVIFRGRHRPCLSSSRPTWSLLIRRFSEISRGSHNSYQRLPFLCGCVTTKKADCSVTVWTRAGPNPPRLI